MVALAFSRCFGCKRLFAYNPVHVPSHLDEATGTKEPVCAACVAVVNPRRIANGLEPIVPHPEAYEACDESELPS